MATFDLIKTYWNLSQFRINVDRIFNILTGKIVSKITTYVANRASVFYVFSLMHVGLTFYAWIIS